MDSQYLLFELRDDRYALPTSVVVELLQAVRPGPLPGSGRVIDGVIAYRGTPVPVFGMRKCFELEDRPLNASDHLVVLRFRGRLAAVRVDRVIGLEAIPESAFTAAERLTAGAGRALRGVARLPDGLVFISNVDALLTDAEAASLAQALEHPPG